METQLSDFYLAAVLEFDTPGYKTTLHCTENRSTQTSMHAATVEAVCDVRVRAPDVHYRSSMKEGQPRDGSMQHYAQHGTTPSQQHTVQQHATTLTIYNNNKQLQMRPGHVMFRTDFG